MVKHDYDRGNKPNPKRWGLLTRPKVYGKSDGLNSLNYKVRNYASMLPGTPKIKFELNFVVSMEIIKDVNRSYIIMIQRMTISVSN